MRSFVCAFERTFASLKRDLFFLRAQFLQNVVASPPSFLYIFADGEQIREEKDDDDKRRRDDITYSLVILRSSIRQTYV